jgi:hypothetical protein
MQTVHSEPQTEVMTLRRRGFGLSALTALFVCVGLVMPSRRVHAQETVEEAKKMASDLFKSTFTVDDDKPEGHVPSEAERNAHPVDFGNFLITLSDKAEEATQKGDHASAAKYYRGLVAAVPESAAGFRRLCASYAAGGERRKAEDACGAALLREDAIVDDYARYVRSVVSQREPLSAKQIGHVDEAVAHLTKSESSANVAADLQCQLGLRLKDEKRLEQCTTALQKHDPKDMKGISYGWLLAVMRLDRKAAASFVERARQAGATADTVQWMDSSTRALRSPFEQAVRKAAPVLAVGLGAGILVGLLLWFARRRQTALRKLNVSVGS